MEAESYFDLLPEEIWQRINRIVRANPSFALIKELPPEIQLHVVLQMPYPDVLRFCTISRQARKICADEDFWEAKTRRDFGAEYAHPPWPREGWEADYLFNLQELEPELIDAVKRGDVEKVRELAEFGVDVNGVPVDSVRLPLESPLMRAAADGSVEIATILLENGADVHAKTLRIRNTALKIAVNAGKVEMSKLLLDYGSDARTRNRVGSEPISAASFNSTSVELVDMLLVRGADINNIGHSGFTLLRSASGIHNNGEYIQALINRRADINSRDTSRTFGYTPLIAATVRLKEENVRVLLENDADTSITDKQGRTALDTAITPGYPNPAIQEMLLSESRPRDFWDH
uniref:F-box domain and ankyrin repeat protein n=1 Tax=Pithovirus LCPAC304 TaxID=2506594 RepID=A0A481Z8J6_9VIRU|nr:MAG: F-box domain and ankyrin repeat protein [Pithovirus LCPAC304]